MFLEPFYGIDRPAVDAQLEIQSRSGGARNRGANPSDDVASGQPLVACDCYIQQVSVEAERLAAVVDDHQVAKACEWRGKSDNAFVHGVRGRTFAGGDFNAVRSLPGRGSDPETLAKGAGDRPVERSGVDGEPLTVAGQNGKRSTVNGRRHLR